MLFLEVDRFDKLNILQCAKSQTVSEIQLTHFFNGLFLNYALLEKGHS